MIELQNHYGWKRSSISPSPTIKPSPLCLLTHLPMCHIYTFLEDLHAAGLLEPLHGTIARNLGSCAFSF